MWVMPKPFPPPTPADDVTASNGVWSSGSKDLEFGDAERT